MTYLYTAENRMETPHNYMYARFEGMPFLRAYLQSRHHAISRLLEADRVPDVGESFSGYPFSVFVEEFSRPFFCAREAFLDLAGGGTSSPSSALNVFVEHDEKEIADSLKINEFVVTEKITTIDLLSAIVTAQLQEPDAPAARIWLDRLIQRFEVTKKLYVNYLPGFRKGEGANDLVRPYWLLALSLSLFYVRSREIKYLSTLLKLGDLLCSLPPTQVLAEVQQRDFQMIIAAEVVSILALAEKKGVAIDTN